MSADGSATGLPEGLPDAKRRLIEQRLRGKARAAGQRVGDIPISTRQGPSLASVGQQWMFLAHQAAPDAAALNVTSSFRVRGTLDLSLLEQCVRRVAVRHDALRSTFVATGTTVERVVHDDARIGIDRVRCSDEDELLARAEALARQPFDLGTPPLLRLHWLEATGADPLLMLVVADLIADRWSLGVFWKEVAALYREARTGTAAVLADLPIRYEDFSGWQRSALESGALDHQLTYWRKRLTALPPAIPLPTDRPFPQSMTGAGRLAFGRVSEAVAAKLAQLAARENTSVFTALLAGFEILLHRYSGLHDIVVGTPIANRRRKETAGLIGFFLSTVALRTRLDENSTARDVLRLTREAVLEAIEHQDVPFDRVVEAVRPERVPGRHPMFQVMFVHQTAAEAPHTIGLGESELRYVQIDTRTSRFDLTLFAAESERGIHTIVEYRTDVFTAETIERMLGHYAQLLESMVASPDRRVGELELLTTDERQRLFVDWQGERRPLEPVADVLDQIDARAIATPDAAAVIGDGRTLSYRDLVSRGSSIAQELRRVGVGPGTPVAHFAARTPDAIAAIVGILKAGGAYVPVDPDYPERRRSFIVTNTRIDTAVTTRRDRSNIAPLIANTVVVDEPFELEGSPGGAAPDENQAAYVIYTSGSTGDPKGVVVSRRNLAYSTDARALYYGSAPQRFLLIPSFSFDSSVAVIFWTLTQGGALVLADADDQRDPSRIRRLIRDHLVTDLLCIPALYREILRHDTNELQTLQRVIVAGEACPPELVARHFEWLPHTSLHNEYGPTEATVWATVHACRIDDGAGGRVVPIGRPIANASAFVLDSRHQPLPVGLAGELWLAGDGTARGYFGRDDLTRERFVERTLPLVGLTRLYRTGDLARWRGDGLLEFLGRIDEQLKVRGYRIEPGEIEAALEAHPAVLHAIVVSQGSKNASNQSEEMTSRVVAYFVTRSGVETPTSDDLRRFLAERLPAPFIPSRFSAVETLPRLPNGKVDRAALASRLDVSPPREPAVAPTSTTELQIMRIWDDLLDGGDVGRDENFFERGGHSLLIPRLADRIQQDFGVALPLGALFETPTVRGIAELIHARNPAHAWRSLVSIRDTGRRAPLYMVHGLGGEIGYFYHLAAYLHPDQPLFGIQASVEPLTELESIAAQYVAEVRQRQPHGPYLLGGYCVGGCIAFEMARQLNQAGEAVRLLAIIDAVTPRLEPETGRLTRRLRRWVRKHPRDIAAELRRRAAGGWKRVAQSAPPEGDEIPQWYGVPAAFHEIATRHYRAVRRYVPRPYAGDVWLFRSEGETDREDLGWSRYVRGKLEIDTIPGHHSDVLKEPHLAVMARRLSAVLDSLAEAKS